MFNYPKNLYIYIYIYISFFKKINMFLPFRHVTPQELYDLTKLNCVLKVVYQIPNEGTGYV